MRSAGCGRKDPAQFAETPRSLSRDRVLSDEELRKIWHGAMNPAHVENLAMSRSTGLAICLAMVTLQRGGEALAAARSPL